MRQRVAIADRIAVMYAGRIVEAGGIDAVIDTPLHPYTVGLLGSVPASNRRGERLTQIPGMPPNVLNLPEGCTFKERCPRRAPECEVQPEIVEPRPGQAVRCFHPHGEANA